MLNEDYNKTLIILDLIQAAASLEVVGEFLKARQLRHSASSWKDMREKRLLPALLENKITNADLIGLLSAAEECGDQHVFLYFCSPDDAIEMIDRVRVSAALDRKGLAHLLVGPDVLTMPPVPTIVDVRWEVAAVDLSLTIKEVEVRTHRKFLNNEVRDDRFYKIYTNEQIRSVNLAKLHRSGALEIRIRSHANTTKYDGDISRFFRQINEFIPLSKFNEVSLTKAKDRFWSERAPLQGIVRYTNASIRDEAGNLLQAVTGSDRNDLSRSEAIGRSIDLLMVEDNNAYCADANIWFLKSDHLSTDIHMLLNGDVNEFALTSKCTEGDYTHVLNQVRYFNR
jgi:hypothetical protein